MAADLHIHVMTPDMTENHLAEFFCNTLGSKYFNMRCRPNLDGDAWRLVTNSPNIHVGEVSWLKAAVLEGGPDEFVPQAVSAVQEIIGEDLPSIDDDLIAKVREAMRLPNQTSYEMTGENAVLSFLAEHKGKRAFTVSW